MESKEPKKRIFNKIIDNAPRMLWVLLAFICLIPLSISFSLNMAHIRAEDYINGMLKIELMKAEKDILANQDIRKEINRLKDTQRLLIEEIDSLKLNSHPPGEQ